MFNKPPAYICEMTMLRCCQSMVMSVTSRVEHDMI